MAPGDVITWIRQRFRRRCGSRPGSCNWENPSVAILCDTRLPRIYWHAARIFARCRSSWAILMFGRRKSIPTFCNMEPMGCAVPCLISRPTSSSVLLNRRKATATRLQPPDADSLRTLVSMSCVSESLHPEGAHFMRKPCYGIKLRMEIFFPWKLLNCAVNQRWQGSYFLIATERQRLVCWTKWVKLK